MKIAVTGHRPAKLGGYSTEVFRDLRRFAKSVLIRLGPRLVITGMAQGWDQAVASAAAALGITFHAYLPHHGQESRWPELARWRFESLLCQAALVKTVSPGKYASWKMQARNEAMVDQLTDPDDVLVALYDGSRGGTANTVRYAERKGVTVLNVWDEWELWIEREAMAV